MPKTTKKTTQKEVTPVITPPKVVTETSKTTKYSNKNLMISPRKLRLLANLVKKLNPVDALSKLKLTNTKAARLLTESVENAIADAKNNHHLLADSIKFVSVEVNEGQKIKRMDKSHGSRFARGIIQKRHSRLNIILSGKLSG
jgi:large subunit ribosomal protein L22